MKTRTSIKIIPPDKQQEIPAYFRGVGLVLVTGVFDLLHPGHIALLNFASRMGPVLVGLFTDEAAEKIHGHKPLQPQDDRAQVLAGIEAVKAVTLLDGVFADDLIRTIHPAVFVKTIGGAPGGACCHASVAEQDTLTEVGAEVAFFPKTDHRIEVPGDLVMES